MEDNQELRKALTDLQKSGKKIAKKLNLKTDEDVFRYIAAHEGEELPIEPWEHDLIIPLKEWEARSNILYYAAGTSAEDEAEIYYWEAWKALKTAVTTSHEKAAEASFQRRVDGDIPKEKQ